MNTIVCLCDFSENDLVNVRFNEFGAVRKAVNDGGAFCRNADTCRYSVTQRSFLSGVTPCRIDNSLEWTAGFLSRVWSRYNYRSSKIRHVSFYVNKYEVKCVSEVLRQM